MIFYDVPTPNNKKMKRLVYNSASCNAYMTAIRGHFYQLLIIAITLLLRYLSVKII